MPREPPLPAELADKPVLSDRPGNPYYIAQQTPRLCAAPRTGTHGGLEHENSGYHGKPPEGQHLSGGRIEDVMRSLGDVEFEYLMLPDVGLEPCRGCFACFERGEERCPIRDDADGVIFASPVYGLAITAS